MTSFGCFKNDLLNNQARSNFILINLLLIWVNYFNNKIVTNVEVFSHNRLMGHGLRIYKQFSQVLTLLTLKQA